MWIFFKLSLAVIDINDIKRKKKYYIQWLPANSVLFITYFFQINDILHEARKTLNDEH